MKVKILAIFSALFVFSCAHTTKTTTTATAIVGGTTANRVIATDDADPQYTCKGIKSLEIKPEILTIELLQKLAECEEYEILNDLYNNKSVHLDSLPVGYAAGKGAKVFNVNSDLITDVLDMFTGSQWKGKMFFPSQSGRESRGLNRIKQFLGPVKPMGSFVTKLIDSHAYVPEVQSGHSLVLLNYAHPARKKKTPIQERLLEKIQVYDLMVAVPGKYGHVYVGKTWLGRYHSETGEFTANDPSKLIAWYFLDYNKGALEHQAQVSDFKEEKMQLPLVTETNIRY